MGKDISEGQEYGQGPGKAWWMWLHHMTRALKEHVKKPSFLAECAFSMSFQKPFCAVSCGGGRSEPLWLLGTQQTCEMPCG